MNKNEFCLIKYLSEGKNERNKNSSLLIHFLEDHGIRLIFKDLNPVYNIIDEMEFSDNIKYN